MQKIDIERKVKYFVDNIFRLDISTRSVQYEYIWESVIGVIITNIAGKFRFGDEFSGDEFSWNF